MDRKQSIVANVRYQTPKGKGASKLKIAAALLPIP